MAAAFWPCWLQRTTQVGVGQIEPGVQGDGRAEVYDRVGKHALLHQQNPKIIVGLHIFRINFQGLAEVRGSLRPIVELVQEQAEIVVGLGILGIDLDGAAVAGQGFIGSPELAQDVRQIIRRLRQKRVDLERLLKGGNGLLGPSLPHQQIAKMVAGHGILRVDFHGPPQVPLGLLALAATRSTGCPGQGQPEVHFRRRKLRIDVQGNPVLVDALVKAPAADEPETIVDEGVHRIGRSRRASR